MKFLCYTMFEVRFAHLVSLDTEVMTAATGICHLYGRRGRGAFICLQEWSFLFGFHLPFGFTVKAKD